MLVQVKRTDPGVSDLGTDLRGLMEALVGAGRGVSSDPEEAEVELQRVSETRGLLGLGHVRIAARISEHLSIDVEEGIPWPCGSLEEPITRGELQVGVLSASSREPAAPLAEDQLIGLRAVVSYCALIVEAAHARGLAATRAAQSSIVQLASEALGTILEEDRLVETVLVLSLDLLGASGGAILLGGKVVASLGLDEEALAALGRMQKVGRKSWTGRVGPLRALGVPVGADGAFFLLRKDGAFAQSEEVSLKLVARQLARARERSLLHAAKEKTTLDAILALSATLETRNGTTGEHIKRTQRLAGQVAQALGLPAERVKDTRYAAMLHDVGKIGVPNALLSKPGKLDESEWEIMRRHPEIGAEILGKIEGFERIAQSTLTHHERFDGRGYPAELSGEEIPIEARIIAAVDSFDAMTNDRPYRRAMGIEEARAELVRCAGSQFDPEVIAALARVLDEKNGEEI